MWSNEAHGSPRRRRAIVLQLNVVCASGAAEALRQRIGGARNPVGRAVQGGEGLTVFPDHQPVEGKVRSGPPAWPRGESGFTPCTTRRTRSGAVPFGISVVSKWN